MQIKVYSLKPFWNITGYFTDILGQPTFDPKHPSIYPGNEVEAVETLSVNDAIAKYGKWIEEPYTVSNPGTNDAKVTIYRFTGKTSADIMQEKR